MCAMEHEEVRQESFWSRVPVFRSMAEFKLHRLRTPETAKKVLQESLRSRFGVALLIGSLGDMHRLARAPAAFGAKGRPEDASFLRKDARTAGLNSGRPSKRSSRGRSEDAPFVASTA